MNVKICSLSNIGLCALLALFSSASFADGNFEGLGVGLNVGATDTNAKYDWGDSDRDSTNKTSGSAQLILEYGIPVTDKFVTTVGATYGLNKIKAGSLTDEDDDTFRAELKNHTSIYVAPGYKVTDNILLYGKVGYHYARAKYTGTTYGEVETNHKNFNGIGYGMGVSYAITPNIEAGLEIQQVRYGKKTIEDVSIKHRSNEYGLHVKYRF